MHAVNPETIFQLMHY